MMALQEKFIFIPFHQLTFHNPVPKELIYYEAVEHISEKMLFKQSTLMTVAEEHHLHMLNNVQLILDLAQNKNFIGLLLCLNKNVTIDKDVIDILTNCEIPIFQIKDPTFLQVFLQINDWFSRYKDLSRELDEFTEDDLIKQAEQLACLFETPFIILDHQYYVAWQAGIPNLLRRANNWLDERRKELIIIHKSSIENRQIFSIDDYLLFPMYVTKTITYTLLVNKHLAPWQRQLINKLACIATLNNQTKYKIKNKLDHFKEHFIHNLLFNNVTSLSALTRQGEGLGWDLNKSHHLLIIDIQSVDKKGLDINLIKKIEMFFKIRTEKLHIQIIPFKFQNQLVILLEDEEERTHLERKNYSLHVAEKLYTFAQTEWPELNLRIGIGNFYPRADQLHKSYQEAKLAIQFMLDWLPNRQVCHITDLGIYRLLLYVPKEILYDFYLETLTPLIESDKEQATDYIKTLQSFYLKQGKLNDVAEELYVHPNTLRNRIKKIEDVTGLNIQEPEGCINLNIATRIMSFISAQQ